MSAAGALSIQLRPQARGRLGLILHHGARRSSHMFGREVPANARGDLKSSAQDAWRRFVACVSELPAAEAAPLRAAVATEAAATAHA